MSGYLLNIIHCPDTRRVDEDLARTVRLVAAERHRLEIEDLMQPGWGR